MEPRGNIVSSILILIVSGVCVMDPRVLHCFPRGLNDLLGACMISLVVI